VREKKEVFSQKKTKTEKGKGGSLEPGREAEGHKRTRAMLEKRRRGKHGASCSKGEKKRKKGGKTRTHPREGGKDRGVRVRRKKKRGKGKPAPYANFGKKEKKGRERGLQITKQQRAPSKKKKGGKKGGGFQAGQKGRRGGGRERKGRIYPGDSRKYDLDAAKEKKGRGFRRP